MRQGAWLRAGRRGAQIFSLLCVQTGAGVHSASCKCVPGGVKTVKRIASHPTSSWSSGCEYVDPCIHIPLGPSWPVVGRSFTASAGIKVAVLPKAGLPSQTQEPRLKFY